LHGSTLADYHRHMTMKASLDPLGELAGLTAAACLFHGFSDPSRLSIVRHLALGEHRVVDLTDHLGLAQSTVSKHLACLKDCGLVTSRPEGRASMWSLNHPDTVVELLAATERLLALTGDAVTLCPTYGTDSVDGEA
jgi:DNA-binding transcriptional ArsR family regulator